LTDMHVRNDTVKFKLNFVFKGQLPRKWKYVARQLYNWTKFFS